MNLSKIHHIAIIVSDYEAAKDFYVNRRWWRPGRSGIPSVPTDPFAPARKQGSKCNLRRAAATGAFASGHSAEHNGHLY